MRIAHIITRMIVGGAQENTLFNCVDLVRIYGDDVLLITGPALGPEGDLLDKHPEHGLEVRYVDALRRNIDPRLDYQSYRQLKRVLRDFRPEVVHTHSAKGGMLGRMAARACRVPAIVHTVHGAPFHPYQRASARKLFQWCEWYAARKCDALISVADAMTDLMVDARVAPRDKFTTIYSGMEVEPFLAADQYREETRQAMGFEPEHVVIGKIARLFHLKGHEYLIEAARNVVAACPQARFLLVGDGILRAQLERQIADAGLSEHFHFAGLVDPQEIPRMLSAMDILVHTSLREGLARALPQALISAKPVVSYDIDGAREVVLNDETGFLIPPRQIDGLGKALTQLVADPQLRRRMGQGGRERFTDQFRHETMTRRIRELYSELLGREA